MTVALPLKWAGGKKYLAKDIVAMMRPHMHYVETHCGGCAVLLERDPNDKSLWVSDKADRAGVSEIVNDIDRELTNFWRVLQDPVLFANFKRLCDATPLSRIEWQDADEKSPLAHVAAHRFFVRCRQSRAGGFKGFTSLTRSRTRRGINGNASEWLSAVEGLPEVHARLFPVVVECMDAAALIRREDTADTLFYCDAPYVTETRTSKDLYAHEMTNDQHKELIETMLSCKGMFMVSMYHHPIYDVLHCKYGWRLVEFDLPNNMAGGNKKRRMTECLWMSYQK